MTFKRSLIIILLLELAVALLAISSYGWSIEGLQATTRFSGRLSLFIFSAIFILLPYHRTKLVNVLSDKFFLIFAIAHGIHLAELISFIYFSGGKFIPVRLAGGALAYAMIFIMPILYGRLLTTKKLVIENIYLFYVWFIFFMTYLPRIQGKLQVGGTLPEFITLFSWVCILLAIRFVLFMTHRKIMLKKPLVVLLVLLSLNANAQSAYDSLKKVYHAQYVFEQREKGDSFKFVKEEISKIKNPELKQLAACAIVSNVYGYGFIDNKKLFSLINDVIDAPKSETILNIATQVRSEITHTLVNTKIQSISLLNPQGETLNLTDYYTSTFDYVIVDLWATWCGPCVAEMKKFNNLRKQYNVEFYSISLDDNVSKVEKFMKRNPDYTWPIVFAGKESPLMDYFKARLIPAFVIVDKNGTIVSHIVGKGLEEELHKLNKK